MQGCAVVPISTRIAQCVENTRFNVLTYAPRHNPSLKVVICDFYIFQILTTHMTGNKDLSENILPATSTRMSGIANIS